MHPSRGGSRRHSDRTPWIRQLLVDTSAIDIGGIIAWLAEVVQGRLERRKTIARIES
jgi:hypothetical protein